MFSLARGLWQVIAIALLAAAVGGAVGALVAVSLVTDDESSRDSSSTQTVPTLGQHPSVLEHLEAIGILFNADWPRVDYSEDWRIALYNSQSDLESEWFNLSGRIYIDGIEMMRTNVEDWRKRFVEWIEDAEEALRKHPSSDSHDSVKAVHSRGVRILGYVDAILGQ